jgi:hypothetical protein
MPRVIEPLAAGLIVALINKHIVNNSDLNRLLRGGPKHEDTREESASSSTSANDVATHHAQAFV